MELDNNVENGKSTSRLPIQQSQCSNATAHRAYTSHYARNPTPRIRPVTSSVEVSRGPQSLPLRRTRRPSGFRRSRASLRRTPREATVRRRGPLVVLLRRASSANEPIDILRQALMLHRMIETHWSRPAIVAACACRFRGPPPSAVYASTKCHVTMLPGSFEDSALSVCSLVDPVALAGQALRNGDNSCKHGAGHGRCVLPVCRSRPTVHSAHALER